MFRIEKHANEFVKPWLPHGYVEPLTIIWAAPASPKDPVWEDGISRPKGYK